MKLFGCNLCGSKLGSQLGLDKHLKDGCTKQGKGRKTEFAEIQKLRYAL